MFYHAHSKHKFMSEITNKKYIIDGCTYLHNLQLRSLSAFKIQRLQNHLIRLGSLPQTNIQKDTSLSNL